uniref:NAD(P)/FAD-dependent oxidoreductase n=1 Tax=Thalassovita aquimarina TaxID=2785917 RepID=UPI003565F5FD
GLEAGPSRAPFRLQMKQVKAAMPGLTWDRATEWMGHRPTLTDSVPVIGPVPGHPGVFMGFGHQHVGLTGGAKTGRLLAQMIGGKTPNLDMSPYDPGRFRA